MTTKSRADLHTQYEVIRNETLERANTRGRVADALQDSLDSVATLDLGSNLDLTGKDVTSSATTAEGTRVDRTVADAGSDGAPVTLASMTALENRAYICKCWVRGEDASTGVILEDSQFTVKVQRNTGVAPVEYGSASVIVRDPQAASVTIGYNFSATDFYLTKQNTSTTAMKWSSRIVWTSDTKL